MLDSDLADAILAALQAARGGSLKIASAEIPAGSQTSAVLVSTQGERFFVKLAPAEQADRFAAEADGLAALRQCDAFKVPETIGFGNSAASAFLILEHLALRPVSREHGTRAGEALAQLHQLGSGAYGWRRDNYIGTSRQTNAFNNHWPSFFAQHRLAPQFAFAAAHGHRGDLQRHGEKICEKISAFFLEYHPRPALLHGDLWHGNIGELDDGTPVIFDPAVYVGDREADLAMTELFGGLPESFYVAYRQAMPLDAGYAQRQQLYNLYHILNHLNLFGRSYLRQAEWMATKLFDYLRN
ncbi:MAG: fructosamine kinase family protein [Betaproteobacteria bacterium]|nr:fructosamine kinase family protein [Betaproteobacteria bacterium]